MNLASLRGDFIGIHQDLLMSSAPSDIFRSTGSTWFSAIVALYVVALITANTVAVSVLDLGPFAADAGTLTFPIALISWAMSSPRCTASVLPAASSGSGLCATSLR
jgi:hypothetical protein